MPDLAIIVPTRGRPASIERLLKAWDKTQSWRDADLWILVDADDPEIGEYRAVFKRWRHRVCQPKVELLPEWLPMVPKLNQAAVRLSASYAAVGFAGDDHLPLTANWAQKLSQAVSGGGVAYPNDLIQGEKLATMAVMHSDIVRGLGWFAPPTLTHLYVDNAWLAIGKGLGKLTYLDDVVVQHMHPMGETAPWDETYELANSEKNIQDDRVEFERWERDDLPGLIAKLKGE